MKMYAEQWRKTKLELDETERSLIQDTTFLLVKIADEATDYKDNYIFAKLGECIDTLEELLDYEHEFPEPKGEN